MSGQKPVLLYDMFPFCKDSGKLSSDFNSARVVSAVVNNDKTAMHLTLSLSAPVAPLDVSEVETMIAREFDMEVTVTAAFARTAAPAARSLQQHRKPRPASTGAVIMGRQLKSKAAPIGGLSIETGKAVVTGEVCLVSHKILERSGGVILSFDLTDYTGTIRVSRHIPDENGRAIADRIETGMHLTVSGKLSLNRYDGELTLDPANIIVAEHVPRRDLAAEKRVELHLHTKMSALDAVTDTAEAIERAAQWGHGAIAITDHGVVHSFPDAAEAAEAAGGGFKVIYGLEGYFFNDAEYTTALYGNPGAGVDELVVFDIETTGLLQSEDDILEIGAVIMKEGRELARFHTFAAPLAPIPQRITEITGLTDKDIEGAPSQKDAVEAFLEFAGGRALVAHNANFDVGFILEACRKHGIALPPGENCLSCYFDTLPLARALLPMLKNHRLETVAAYFGREEFSHHRAVDDASVTAHIFFSLLKKLEEAGVNGYEAINAYLAELSESELLKGRVRSRHIIILAASTEGLRNLYKLVTISHLQDFNKASRVPIIRRSVLERHREGLIIGSACEAGELYEAVTGKKSYAELCRIAEYYDYLEIQPVCNNLFMIRGENPRAADENEIRSFNKLIVKIGKELGKPVVATGDVHFLEPEHEVFRQILQTSRDYADALEKLPIYFKTTDEMLDEFSYLGEETAYDVVIGNTRLIADMCGSVNPLPPKKTLFAPELDRSAEDLKELVTARLAELYGDNPPGIVSRRVDTELGGILNARYDVIYMTAQKLVAESNANGYIVGSRGSVGSSIVAYLAGITEVNALPAHYRCPSCRNADFSLCEEWGCGVDMPDALCPVCGAVYEKDGYNIPFETFLGFDGDKVPDIDLNFSGEYQAQAHKFTTELFGADYVFRAGTIGKIADKTAYGYVKHYLDKVGKTVTKAEENRLSRGCTGVKQTTGQHPGGLVVIPQNREITDFCPAQRPADAVEKDIITTHFEYHSMEDNLIKLDELGHDDPTMLKMLQEMTGVGVGDIKLDDPDTMSLFLSPEVLGLPFGEEVIGETGSIGIPEFGTQLTRQMLSDTKPEDFETLVRLSGFAHGTDVWLGNARDLVLSGTATVKETIGCRDDIMLFLISRGMDDRRAFRISESVRKSYGLPEGAEEEMLSCGVPLWYIESCKKIKYLFPKAHAVAYVMMAFRIAWFKVHRPLEFYSAHFYRRSQNDGFDAESMTRGIKVVRAKIKEIKNNTEATAKDEKLLRTLESCYEFYLRGYDFSGIDIYESDPVRFLITGENKLRPPFVAVSGLGEAAARDIAEKREGREFVSIDDLSTVCQKVTKAHIEQLKKLGALRDMPESSQLSLF